MISILYVYNTSIYCIFSRSFINNIATLVHMVVKINLSLREWLLDKVLESKPEDMSKTEWFEYLLDLGLDEHHSREEDNEDPDI